MYVTYTKDETDITKFLLNLDNFAFVLQRKRGAVQEPVKTIFDLKNATLEMRLVRDGPFRFNFLDFKPNLTSGLFSTPLNFKRGYEFRNFLF